MTVDLLVAGGGIAGMAAAARAIELGLQVVVAEKGDEVGGSAALSAGIVWTAPDVETARRVAPEGDPALLRALIEGFDAAIERVRDAGVAVSERWSGQMGFGVEHHVDLSSLLEHYRAPMAGALSTRTTVAELRVDGDGPCAGRCWTRRTGRSTSRPARSCWPPGVSRAMPSSSGGSSAGARSACPCGRIPGASATACGWGGPRAPRSAPRWTASTAT